MTFTTPEEADVALGFLDGALFTYRGPSSTGGQRAKQLNVARWDGRERFDQQREDADAEQDRIDRWNEFLGSDNESEEEDEKEDATDVPTVDTDDEGVTGADSGAETE